MRTLRLAWAEVALGISAYFFEVGDYLVSKPASMAI
jgi:hypothetical protein